MKKFFFDPLIPRGLAIPSFSNIDLNSIIEEIANGVVVIILAVTVLYGGYALFEGFSEDNPTSKKRGFVTIAAGVVISMLIYVILTNVFGITFG